MREHDVQNAIRVHVSKHKLGTLFRGNVGTAWQGNIVYQGGEPVLQHLRPFSTGLPEGFPDLFGFTPVQITEDMIGEVLPVFCALEIKAKTGRIRPKQQHMLEFLRTAGCRVGVARSPEQAERILKQRLP